MKVCPSLFGNNKIELVKNSLAWDKLIEITNSFDNSWTLTVRRIRLSKKSFSQFPKSLKLIKIYTALHGKPSSSIEMELSISMIFAEKFPCDLKKQLSHKIKRIEKEKNQCSLTKTLPVSKSTHRIFQPMKLAHVFSGNPKINLFRVTFRL